MLNRLRCALRGHLPHFAETYVAWEAIGYMQGTPGTRLHLRPCIRPGCRAFVIVQPFGQTMPD